MGYDPEKHFPSFKFFCVAKLTVTDKRNTLILPEYHRKGLGTCLTMHCNDIADMAGQPTFVLSVKRAWKMLERTGFVLFEKIRSALV